MGGMPPCTLHDNPEHESPPFMSTITIVHPAAEAAAAPTSAAPAGAARIASLAGKRVALMINGKVNAKAILTAVATRLQARGAGEVRGWEKQHAGESGKDVLPGLIGWKPDLALSGLGD